MAKIKHRRIRSTTSIPQNNLCTIEVSLDDISAMGRAYVFFVLYEVVDGGIGTETAWRRFFDEDGSNVSVLQRVVITYDVR